MALPKETEDKIAELQMMEQSMQGFLLQKQAFQSQLLEVESALGELAKTPQAYRIVGGIMAAADKEALKAELEQRKETLSLRVKAIEKQEARLKERASKTQGEVMEEMKRR
jgi:prefoldin beta subunit